MKYNIAAIIVTFNRKELLGECLNAIERQTYKPNVAYIIDNASTDGTGEWIQENGYDGIKEEIEYRYIRLDDNIGGAGGFYTGLKMAHEASENFDAFWVMDDDGIADVEQLHNLTKHLTERDYISPMVVAKEDSNRISFGGSPLIQDFIRKADAQGLIEKTAFPFNGILYSRHLIEVVGYPNKDLFIWGDEINYNLRCINKGFYPVVVVDAIHIHPMDRQPREKLYGNIYMIVPPQEWKLYCYVRNHFYTIRTESTIKHVVGDIGRFACRYTIYFTFYKFDWKKLFVVFHAIFDGSHKDLSQLNRYKN